jgi:hypothetical protein
LSTPRLFASLPAAVAAEVAAERAVPARDQQSVPAALALDLLFGAEVIPVEHLVRRGFHLVGPSVRLTLPRRLPLPTPPNLGTTPRLSSPTSPPRLSSSRLRSNPLPCNPSPMSDLAPARLKGRSLMKPSKLTDKEKVFCREYAYRYLGKPGAAAGAAGYAGDSNTLSSVGCQLLRRPRVRRRIDKLLEGRILTDNEAMTRLSDIAGMGSEEKRIPIFSKDGDLLAHRIDAGLTLAQTKALDILLKAKGRYRDPLHARLDALLERELDKTQAIRSERNANAQVIEAEVVPALPAGKPDPSDT